VANTPAEHGDDGITRCQLGHTNARSLERAKRCHLAARRFLSEDVTVTNVVYLLGAGFNCSVLDPMRNMEAPLARNFFQVLAKSGRLRDRLDAIRGRLFVDLLLGEIERYWKLDLEALTQTSFDIEECLTLFESQLADGQSVDRELTLRRAAFAMRNLLLMYLGELSSSGYTPVAMQFGHEVLGSAADVLTFNYDTLAEESIASSSGIGPKPQPGRPQSPELYAEAVLADADLDASHFTWKPGLAYGFKFDEVSLPVAGVLLQIAGDRYYGHPNNALYEDTRVLKLHGSIDWLKYTAGRVLPAEYESQPPGPTPSGIVLERHPDFWMGESPTRNGWHMEPVVIPPQLYKQFREEPFPKLFI